MPDFSLTHNILRIGEKLIERLWTDPKERERAKAELLRLAHEGELQEVEQQLLALVAEEKTSDPWTARARPAFLYVAYLVILWAIPMGFLHAIRPEIAVTFQQGMQGWWSAIPGEFWMAFTVSYTGYTLARSYWDKKYTAPSGKG